MDRIRKVKNKFLAASLPIKIGIVLAVLVVGWITYSHFKPSNATQAQYQTDQATKGTLIVSVTESGTISNANSGSIGTQASGVVTKIDSKNSDQVKQGDPIAEIELDQVGKQNFAQASASYTSAKNNLQNANDTYFALQADLFNKNKTFNDIATNSFYTNGDGSPNTTNRQLPDFIVAQDNWFSAEASYKRQQNVIAQAQASLNSAWLNYEETSPTVYAPISGTVTGLSLQVGSVLTNQTTTTGATSSQKIASIKTQAAPMVTVNVTEIDVPSVQIGDKATITMDAFPNKTFTGKVVSIDTIGAVSSGVTNYPTTIQFDTAVPGVLSNMSAQANIITNVKDDVLLVPSVAVQTQGGQSSVRVMKNGQPVQTTVETGLSSSTQTEITSGLSEGDTVVTSVITTGAATTTTGASPFGRIGGAAGGGGAVIRGGGGGGGRFGG